MLPSSHPVLIEHALGAGPAGNPLCIPALSAGPAELTDTAVQAQRASMLASAFSEFMAASSRLEESYRDLQAEVNELRLELSERNAALRISLAENERMRGALQQIVDSMPCGVVVVSGDHEISMMNPESIHLLGVDPGPEIAQSPSTLSELAAKSGINLSCFRGSESGSDHVQEIAVRSGSDLRWLEIRNRRVMENTSQSASQSILIIRDITAQKRAEQDRESARKAVALAEVSSILAHEIRNPLASLELFAELIETDDDRRSEWISHLRAGIRSLSGTVNNVLALRGGALKRSTLDLTAFLEDALEFVKPLIDQASIKLEAHIGQGEYFVMANEGALRQVVLNLVTNAIRYTPEGGSITVSLHSVAGKKSASAKYQLEIVDSGCGIRADQINQIFEVGFSGSGVSSGLGLAVCEHIMREHGGRINADNAPHGGARFIVQFPALQEEAAQI